MFQASNTPALTGKVIIVSNSGLELSNPEVAQDDTGILLVDSRSNLLTASKVEAITLLSPESVIKTGAATGDATFMQTSVPSLQVLANAEVVIGTQFGVPFFKVTAKGKDHYHRCSDVAIHVFPSTEATDAAAPAEVPAAAPATAAPARRGRGSKATTADAAPAVAAPEPSAVASAADIPAPTPARRGRGGKATTATADAAPAADPAAVAAQAAVAAPAPAAPAPAAEAPAAPAAGARRRRTPTAAA